MAQLLEPVCAGRGDQTEDVLGLPTSTELFTHRLRRISRRPEAATRTKEETPTHMRGGYSPLKPPPDDKLAEPTDRVGKTLSSRKSSPVSHAGRAESEAWISCYQDLL